MSQAQLILIYTGSLVFGMLLLIFIGRVLGRRRLQRDPDSESKGTSTIESAMFALFGLLVAFTFSNASSRFDARRNQVMQEVDALGTAYQNVDLVTADRREEIRGLFRQYVDSRRAFYNKMPDMKSARLELRTTVKLQSAIWDKSVAALSADPNPSHTSVLLPSLSATFGMTTIRSITARMHTPWIIFLLLHGMALFCAFLVGHEMAGTRERNLAHLGGFILATAVTVCVTLAIEYPRNGLVPVDSLDRSLDELREGMN